MRSAWRTCYRPPEQHREPGVRGTLSRCSTTADTWGGCACVVHMTLSWCTSATCISRARWHSRSPCDFSLSLSLYWSLLGRCIAVGISTKNFPLSHRMPGWDINSCKKTGVVVLPVVVVTVLFIVLFPFAHDYVQQHASSLWIDVHTYGWVGMYARVVIPWPGSLSAIGRRLPQR